MITDSRAEFIQDETLVLCVHIVSTIGHPVFFFGLGTHSFLPLTQKISSVTSIMSYRSLY